MSGRARRRARRPARPRGRPAAPTARCASTRRWASAGVGHLLDVVGGHEVASLEQGVGPGQLHQGQRAARAGPDLQLGLLAGGGDDGHGVAADRLADVHPLQRRAAWRARRPPSPTGASATSSVPRSQAAVDELPLVVVGRVADRRAQQEAVELGLGQRVGALVLDRVLGGDHEERPGERVGHAVGGDLALLHGLEQRGLGLGRRPVDLVGQDQVGEDRAGPEGEPAVCRWSSTTAPVMSAGSRSGVNWMRWKASPVTVGQRAGR